MVAYGHAARRLTRQRHLAGITAEVSDVVAHPAQRRLLIGEAVVSDVARRSERRMGQEAHRAQPVVDGYDDHVAPSRQPARVVDACTAADERAAVDPHHDRPLPPACAHRRCPHVQGQAILVGLPSEFWVTAGILQASRSDASGVAHPLPGGRRGRRLPAERADRRCGIRDSGEQPVIRGDGAAHHARDGLHHRRIRRMWRHCGLRGLIAAAAATDRQQHAEGEHQQAVKRSGRHEVRA
jgi:hypothetical protein